MELIAEKFLRQRWSQIQAVTIHPKTRTGQEERVKMEIEDQSKWWRTRKDQGGRIKMEKFNPI